MEKKNAEELFNKAVEISDTTKQEKYLDEACAGDDKLRAEVEALLKWDREAGSFLDNPDGDPNATLETSASPECSGTVIGRYKLLEKIGEGGMATVYMAEQKQPIRRRVALKIIKLGMDTKQVIARFEVERQALAMMDHPNIARVLDAGTTESGRPYFVMELVRGVAITEFCDKNHLNTKERLELFISVCQAVQHAHQKGIIHRDIKPSNVMVTLHDGRPVIKVIDFGIAKAVNQQLTEKTVFTRYSQMIGTPEYMSPEQAEMSGLDIDTRTDVFSLGVLLYELLTGTTPFDSEYLLKKGYGEMQRIIREEEPTRPSTKLSTMGEALTEIAKCRHTSPELLRKLIRSDLDWIVMKTLEKDRQRRYESVSELAAEVCRHLNHESVLAGRPSGIYRLKKFLVRNRTKVISASAVAVLIAAVVVIFTMYVQSVNRGKEAESFEHREVLSKAQEFRSNGQFQEALAKIETIVDSKYVGPEAHLLHARLVMELREPAEALAELQSLLNERDEIACQAHFLIARIYLESDLISAGTAQQRQQKAKEHQQKGEELFSESAMAYFNRAMIAGTVSKTLECLDKALNLDPDHYPSLRARALSYYAIRDFRRMERDAVVMTRLKDWDYLGHSLMAIALREGKEFDEAIKFHNEAIARSSEDPELYDQRRRTHMRITNYEQALSDARRSIRINPGESMYHFHYFCALVALGRYDEARAKYDSIASAGVHSRLQFASVALRYVTDTLNAGLLWHPTGQRPEGAAFLMMHDATRMYEQLSKKARRVVAEGFHPDWSPDGTELVYSRGFLGRAGIEIMDLQSKKARLLTVPGFNPAWSPDGQYIAYTRGKGKLLITELLSDRSSDPSYFGDREIWVIKADGSEEPRYLAEGYWPSWSSDSMQVLYHSKLDDIFHAISVESGAESVSIAECEGYHPIISPDGKYVAYSARHGGKKIIRLSDNSVVASFMMPPTLGANVVNWSPDGRELSVGGVGLWIYDVETRRVARIFGGINFFGWASWSGQNTRFFAVERDLGESFEIWMTSLDPNMTTRESLGPGLTIEEHCREMVDSFTLRIEADSEDVASYLFLASFHICLQEYDKATANIEKFIRVANSNSTIGGAWFVPRIMDYLAAWGIQKYTVGAYDQSLATLTLVDRFRTIITQANPADVATIAMSLHQLCRDEQAESALERLRGMFEKTKNDESLTWLCRAEKVFVDDSDGVRQVWELIEFGKLNDAWRLIERLRSSQTQDSDGDLEKLARVTNILVKAYYQRGRDAEDGSRYSQAISDYEAAVHVDPNYVRALSDLAWLLAMCEETELRDEIKAVENATRACELTGWKDHLYVANLAAICAEFGDFDNAVKLQKEATGLLTKDERSMFKTDYESRLMLYESHKPFHTLYNSGMIGWWKLDNDAKDSSGSGYHGIIKGDPKWVVTPMGGALEFDGIDDYIQTPDDIDKLQLTGDYTFSLWIKADATQNGWVGIFSKCNPSGSMNHWTLQFDGSSPKNLIIHHPDNLPMPRFWDTGIRLTDITDASHHISIVRSVETMTSYLDGSLRKSGTWHNDPGSGNGHLNIGVDRTANPGSTYKGLLHDLRIYNYVLTEAEIMALYNDGKLTSEEDSTT